MANDNIKLYNFYRRYKWNEHDFAGWQDGMVSLGRGMLEGIFGAAVLDGFGISLTGGLDMEVGAGIACGPTGTLLVKNDSVPTTLTAPVSDVERILVVIRPDLVDGDFIINPTNPLQNVPLTTAQRAKIEFLRGTPSTSPDYPAKDPGDTVLFGLRLVAGQVALTIDDFDFEVRDMPGKNSNFQQNQAKYDDRARFFRVDNFTGGVKPSQTKLGDAPKSFLYINKGTPSRFPLDGGGLFNYADTFINFQTGQISGGDAQSPDFTPTIPGAGEWIVATVSLTGEDRLSFAYGVVGTRAQCIDAVTNARTAGAGSVALPANQMRLAFVFLYSIDGTNITEMDFYDGRSTLYFGGPDSAKNYPNVFLSALGNGDATNLAAAVALLPVGGGVLVVMDDVIVPAEVTLPANTKIIGRGRATGLNITGTGGIVLSDNCSVQDLKLTTSIAATCIKVSGGNCVIEKNVFTMDPAFAAVGVSVLASGVHIGENVFIGVSGGLTLANGIVFAMGSSESSSEYNIFI